MKDFLFIINPAAGKVNANKLIKLIEKQIKKYDYTYDIIQTLHPLHATQISENVNGYKYLIAAGGDGTLNEIINGLNNNELTIGILPLGSGNDFIKNLNLNKKIKENLELIFEKKYIVKQVDIGLVKFREEHENEFNQTRFLNAVGIGFDAYVANLNQRNKILSGIFSYIFAVLRALSNYKALNSHIEIDGKKLNGENLLITIGNGISSGGGFYLTKNALVDDGLLDVCIIKFIGRFKLLRKLPLALFNKIDQIKEVKLVQTESVGILLDQPYFMHTDGESPSRNVKEIEVSLLKEKFYFISKR